MSVTGVLRSSPVTSIRPGTAYHPFFLRGGGRDSRAYPPSPRRFNVRSHSRPFVWYTTQMTAPIPRGLVSTHCRMRVHLSASLASSLTRFGCTMVICRRWWPHPGNLVRLSLVCHPTTIHAAVPDQEPWTNAVQKKTPPSSPSGGCRWAPSVPYPIVCHVPCL
jgi:hypothetical protein